MALISPEGTADSPDSVRDSTPSCIWLSGMRRSGNHAFVHWIRTNLGRPTAHVNNVFVTRRTRWVPTEQEISYIADRARGVPLDPSQVTWSARSFEEETHLGGTGVYFTRSGGELERAVYLFDDTARSMEVDEACAVGTRRLKAELEAWSQTNRGIELTTIYSVEDRLLAPPLLLHSPEAPRCIVIVRDPANWLASRLRLAMPCGQEIVDAYCEMADAAIHRPEIVGVNYLAWARSSEYRLILGHLLGLQQRAHMPIMSVPSFAGGSSFDGLTLDGKADRMAVEFRHLNVDVADRVTRIMRDDDRLKVIEQQLGVENEWLGSGQA